MDPSKWPKEQLAPLPGGRGPLLAAAKLHILFAIYARSADSGSDPFPVVQTMHQSAIINFWIGAAFVALWATAKAKPFPATVAGLVLLIAAQIVNGLHNPALLVGSLAALIILGFLLRSIRAAKAAADLERNQG